MDRSRRRRRLATCFPHRRTRPYSADTPPPGWAEVHDDPHWSIRFPLRAPGGDRGKAARHPIRTSSLVHIRRADKIAPFNPLRRVPTVLLDDGKSLIDSAAILDWLDENAATVNG